MTHLGQYPRLSYRQKLPNATEIFAQKSKGSEYFD